MKGMKRCLACGTDNGTRARQCSKCGQVFSMTSGPTRSVAKRPMPKAAGAAKTATGDGTILDLVESLASTEARLCAFEQMDEIDVIINEVRRAMRIAKAIGA